MGVNLLNLLKIFKILLNNGRFEMKFFKIFIFEYIFLNFLYKNKIDVSLRRIGLGVFFVLVELIDRYIFSLLKGGNIDFRIFWEGVCCMV